MRLRALAVVRQLDAGRDDAGLAEEDRDLKGYHEKTGWRATLWREPQATRRRRSRGESVCLERSHLLPWTPELETFGPTPESNHAHGLRADSNGTHARSVNVAVRYGHARCEQPCTCCEQGTVRQDFSPPPTKGSEAGRWRRKHAASVLSLISEQATTHAASTRARVRSGCRVCS